MGNLTSDDGFPPPVNMIIDTAGASRVNENSAYIYAGDKNCVAIYADMHSKRCEVAATSSKANGPMIYIFAGADSLHLDESKERNSFTAIRFPDYAGWSVFSANISKYTLAVCLVYRPDEATP